MDKRITTIKDYSSKEGIEIMGQEEIKAIVNKYLEDGNTFSELIKKKGLWTWGGNTDNLKVIIEIDTRDGEIGTRVDTPGNSEMDGNFYIDLSEFLLLDKEETIERYLDDGDDMETKALTIEQMTELIFESAEDTLEFIECESLEADLEGFYAVQYDDVHNYNDMDREAWISKVCKEDYDKLLGDVIDCVLGYYEEQVENVEDWENAVKKFYEAANQPDWDEEQAAQWDREPLAECEDEYVYEEDHDLSNHTD